MGGEAGEGSHLAEQGNVGTDSNLFFSTTLPMVLFLQITLGYDFFKKQLNTESRSSSLECDFKILSTSEFDKSLAIEITDLGFPCS